MCPLKSHPHIQGLKNHPQIEEGVHQEIKLKLKYSTALGSILIVSVSHFNTTVREKVDDPINRCA